jgi:hypothetical protein
MANQVKNINILEVSRGAIMEQIDIEMKKILDNLLDPNTDHKPARTLNVKVTFKCVDDKRDLVNMNSQAKATLVANMPVGTMLYTEISNGKVMAAELNKPDPNQVSIDEEQGTATTNMINIAERRQAHG